MQVGQDGILSSTFAHISAALLWPTFTGLFTNNGRLQRLLGAGDG